MHKGGNNMLAGVGSTVAVASSAHAAGKAPSVLHEPRTRRIANRRMLLVSFVAALTLLVLVVIVGRFVLYDTATSTDFSQKNLAPSLEHLFGTDWMGRDMFARTIAGLSLSVLVGLLAAGVSSAIAEGRRLRNLARRPVYGRTAHRSAHFNFLRLRAGLLGRYHCGCRYPLAKPYACVARRNHAMPRVTVC